MGFKIENLNRRATPLVLAVVVLACADGAPRVDGQDGSLAEWSIDTTPLLRLGAANDDTTQLFAVVIGATRLPGGRVLVADRSDHTFHVYSPEGAHLAAYGRQGDGPGEFQFPARFWRCGDSVLVFDISGYQTSVFNLDGKFERAFRFGNGAQEAGSSGPYRSTCNSAGTFAHYGWDRASHKPGDPMVYRKPVPFWMGRADSIVTDVLDSFPGSERMIRLSSQTGLPAGDGPRMFGKQTGIALGSSRLYIGTAEGPHILSMSLPDQAFDTIRLPWTPAPLTEEMIAAEKAVQLATSPSDRHAGIERDFEAEQFPDTLPPYANLLVDSEDMLWVEGYPAGAVRVTVWTIVSTEGRPMARVALPSYLTVFEIGNDYVLGRYIDPIESIPEVRMYRLRRRE
jgi:hypothetical protein